MGKITAQVRPKVGPLIVTALFSLGLWASGQVSAHGSELFRSVADRHGNTELGGVQGVERYRFVSVDLARLGLPQGGSGFAPETQVTLNLFPDVRVRAELERVGSGNAAAWLWVGRCVEPGPGMVVLAFGESNLSGTVVVEDRIYQIRSDGDRVHAIRELSFAKSRELYALIVGSDARPVERRLFDLINYERAMRGLPEYTWNEALARAAREHSRDMGRRDFFGHVNPDGQDPGDRMKEVGYAWSAWSENVAAGQRAPIEVLEAWLSSPGHRANIINEVDDPNGVSLTDAGVGHAQYPNNALNQYWTLKLGRR